jgi:uncharacterized protein
MNLSLRVESSFRDEFSSLKKVVYPRRIWHFDPVKKHLIVSLHDVTSSTFPKIERQLSDLSRIGVTRTSLLVIPHYHGREEMDKDSHLCDELKKYQERGHEIVLHGWKHLSKEVKGQPNDLSHWFYRNLYTANEAEFLSLDYETASSLIRKGQEMFAQKNLNPKGFIAPAWLMNNQVERALKDLGFQYTNNVSELIDFAKDRRIPTRSCVWSTRAAWRSYASLAWNALLFHRLQDIEPLRISLHPGDLDQPRVWRQVKKLIQLATQNRLVTTYGSWIQNA